jgi:hypothetical protein
MNWAFDDLNGYWIDLGLNKRRAGLKIFFLNVSLRIYRAINKFLPLNESLHWLNDDSCLFLSFPLITSGVQLCIDRSGLASSSHCTKRGWCCICNFPPAMAYNLHSPPANGKQGQMPEEMSQTLLTNMKQGNLD